MKQITFNLKKPVTMEALKSIVETEKVLTKALESLGYSTEKDTVAVTPGTYQRLVVFLNGKYFGIWDTSRNTFVD